MLTQGTLLLLGTRINTWPVGSQFLDTEGIDAINWPLLSPDLIPIENHWDIMYNCTQDSGLEYFVH